MRSSTVKDYLQSEKVYTWSEVPSDDVDYELLQMYDIFTMMVQSGKGQADKLCTVICKPTYNIYQDSGMRPISSLVVNVFNSEGGD